MSPAPVLIDCDPGIDDAIALLLAFASPELAVAGVTTVAGNVGVERAFANAASVLDLAGVPASVPLVPGHGAPLASASRVPDEPVHGPGGLGGVTLPASARRIGTIHSKAGHSKAGHSKAGHSKAGQPKAGHPEAVHLEPFYPEAVHLEAGHLEAVHAVDWLAAELRRVPGRHTLIALGPLTNVAGLLHRYPEAAGWVREIVVMGGAAFAPGNVTPAAEFNFHADPEAARYVLESGAPVRLVPLDVTRRALFPRSSAELLAALGGAAGAAGRMLAYLADRCAERAAARRVRGPAEPEAACPVHDALAVAAVLRPDLLDWTPAAASVECAGTLTRGALVADVLGRGGGPMTTQIATGVDAKTFTAFLAERLGTYAGVSA